MKKVQVITAELIQDMRRRGLYIEAQILKDSYIEHKKIQKENLKKELKNHNQRIYNFQRKCRNEIHK